MLNFQLINPENISIRKFFINQLVYFLKKKLFAIIKIFIRLYDLLLWI